MGSVQPISRPITADTLPSALCMRTCVGARQSSSAWDYIPAEQLRALASPRHPLAGLQDPLTRLPNRSAVHAILDGFIERNEPVGVILIDVDGFKEVNDTQGHEAGDQLLRIIAGALSAGGNEGEIAARLGGDEFIILVPDAKTPQILKTLSSRFLQAIRNVSNETEAFAVHASAGSAHFPQNAQSTAELIRSADVALFEAKGRGRDRAEAFSRAMQLRVDRAATMRARARNCLDASSIEVVFQPKVDLTTQAVCGYEALFRCRDESGRLRRPNWIGAAFEDPSLAVALGQVVQEQSLAFVRKLFSVGRTDAKVAINVTSLELRRPGWVAEFMRRVKDAQVPVHIIELEISESVLLGRSARQATAALESLHSAGFRISLDDFGTGFASLSHLRSCPVDALKIDRSFLKELDEARNSAIVQAIIQLARTLGLGVVAEGVESREQHDRLLDWGCLEGQGHLYGFPSAPDRWLSRRSKSHLRAA